MRAIILAGGFAKRLGEIGHQVAKPLIQIGDKPVIQHIVDKISRLEIDEIVVTVNLRFKQQFLNWAEKLKVADKVRLVVEGSLVDEDKPGAVRALYNVFADGDHLVVAGDNLFTAELQGMVEYYNGKRAPVVAVYELQDEELVKEYSTVKLGDDNRVIEIVEKPREPSTSTVGTCIYILPEWCKVKLGEYLRQGGDPDSPGRFMGWLSKETSVYGFKLGGIWIDIGSIKGLKIAQRIYKQTQ